MVNRVDNLMCFKGKGHFLTSDLTTCTKEIGLWGTKFAETANFKHLRFKCLKKYLV